MKKNTIPGAAAAAAAVPIGARLSIYKQCCRGPPASETFNRRRTRIPIQCASHLLHVRVCERACVSECLCASKQHTNLISNVYDDGRALESVVCQRSHRKVTHQNLCAAINQVNISVKQTHTDTHSSVKRGQIDATRSANG